MRRFYSSALASAILFLGGTSVKADYDFWALTLTENSQDAVLFKGNFTEVKNNDTVIEAYLGKGINKN